MGSGQRLGQKTGVNWQGEMPGVQAETHIESRPQTKRPQGLSTWKGGRGLLGRPFPQSSPAFEHSKMKFEILWSAHLGQWAAIIGARCWLFGLKRTWLNAHLRVCVSVCVRAHHTSSHLVDDEKREDPPFRTLWHVHAPPSSRWVSVCLFHAKLLTRLTEIPLSLPPVPSAACCFSFYCWIYAPSSVISFGLTQIFGSCHLVPICWTNKPNARHDSRPNSGSRSIVNNFLLPDSSSSHCSICVAGYSQLISIFKKICGIFMEFLSMANK